MGKCAHPNPDYVPLWNDKDHKEYLNWAYQQYCSKEGDPRPPRCTPWREPPPVPPPINIELLEFLYKLGRDLQVLKFPFEEFCKWITKGPPPRQFSHNYIQTPYRHRQKYRRKKPHKKKTGEHVRFDWRKRKGFALDQGKSKWIRSAPVWAKKISSRARRQWEREQIQKQDWDDLASGDYLRFIDRWIWD